jgi:hypothetical protein
MTELEYHLQMARTGEVDIAFHGLLELPADRLLGLCDAFRAEFDPDMREMIVRVISRLGGPDAFELLRTALSDPRPKVWKSALDGLLSNASPVFRRTIEQAKGEVPSRDLERLAWSAEAIKQIDETGAGKMRCGRPPAGCPRCGSSRTVRLIWRCVELLYPDDEKDVEAGTAFVVHGHLVSYFEQWQSLMQRRNGELPTWSCLDCYPGWRDVHQMAMQIHRMQMEKEESVVAMRFDRAGELEYAQYRERDRLVTAVARMLEVTDRSRRESI